MSLVSLANVEYSIGTRRVLNGISFSIEPDERVGIVGRNGCGKSTLLRMIAGHIKPDVGDFSGQRNCRIGYLAQDTKFEPGQTVFDVAEGAFAQLHAVHEQMHALADQMGQVQGDALDAVMRRYSQLEAEVEGLGGYAIEHRVEETLHGLGFVDAQFTLKVESLSGGQRARLALARLLLEEPELLLLDEPTNHLDIEGRRWLEEYLSTIFKGAVALVSHDRYLLDRVVNRIAEIEPTGLISYPGNYAKFRELRAERMLTQTRHWSKQQDRVRSEEKFIQRYKTGQRAKQARGRQARLDRFKDEIIERPVEASVMKLKLPKSARCGDLVISADGLTKTYDQLTLFKDFDFTVLRGERIGIIGSNGSGKSTLVRCLIGEQEPDDGKAKLGSGVSMGHFRQIHDHIDPELAVWQYLQKVILAIDGAKRASEQEARDLAGAFLFSGDDQDKTLGVLSGGERSRAILAGLVAGGHNLLVLDEPTNHFDIPSSERLEQALHPETGFDGTLLLISHDRALLDACADRIVAFEGDGQVRIHEGNYTSYVRAAESRQAREQQNQPTPKSNSKQQASSQSKSKPPKTDDAPKKSNPHKHLSQTKLDKEIDRLQKTIAQIDEDFLDPAVLSDGQRVKDLRAKRDTAVTDLEALEEEWLNRAAQT